MSSPIAANPDMHYLETGMEPPKEADSQDNKRDLSIGVVAAFVVMVISNVLSTSTKVFNNTDNKIISDANPTYVSPDGATFSIWGFIYLFEATLIVYQALPAYKNAPGFDSGRPYIIAAFLLNALWLPVFQFYYWWLSLAIIVAYLAALWKSYETLNIDYAGEAAWHTKVFAYVGLSLNLSWVTVATLLNVTVVARNSDIITTTIVDGVSNTTSGSVALPGSTYEAVIGGNPDWAVLCIVIAALFAAYRSISFTDVPYAFVCSWALGGIYRMQTSDNDSAFPVAGHSKLIADWSLTVLIVVAVVALVGVARSKFFK